MRRHLLWPHFYPVGQQVLTIPIPPGWRHVNIIGSQRAVNAAATSSVVITLNGDSGAGKYAHQYIQGNTTNGAQAGQGENISTTAGVAAVCTAASAGTPLASTPMDLMIYNLQSARHKTIISRFGRQEDAALNSLYSLDWASCWLDTSVVNSVTLTSVQGAWAAGSVFSVYGIGAPDVTVSPAGSASATLSLAKFSRGVRIIADVWSNAAAANDNVTVVYNGDGSALYGYSYILGRGNGALAATAGTAVAQTNGLVGQIVGASGTPSNSSSILDITIPYLGPDWWKVYYSRSMRRESTLTGGLWLFNIACLYDAFTPLNSAVLGVGSTFGTGSLIDGYEV